MYTLYEHGMVIASRIRTDAYLEALQKAVKPGSVVVDIGTGIGIFAFFACRFGARKVYAIEFSDEIEVARETAELNGFSDRIEFIQDLSTRVTLPEKADVIVSEIHSVLPMYGMSLPSLIDGRQRFLAPNGVMIPQREELWAAVVADAEFHDSFVGPWESDRYGMDMHNIQERVVNTWRKRNVRAEQLLTEPRRWAVLDYNKLADPNVGGLLSWTVASESVAHGICAWFDSTLFDGVFFSGAPGSPRVIFGQAFFPWPEGVQLIPGDTVSVTLRASLVASEYIWLWDTVIARGGKKLASFRQSTFQGTLISRQMLEKHRPSWQPLLTHDGEIDRLVLSRIDGNESVEQIARELQTRFPDSFSSPGPAQERVLAVCARYGK